MKSKVKNSIILKLNGITTLAIILIIYFSMFDNFNWQYGAFCVLLLIMLIYSIKRLLSLKEVSCTNSELKIVHLYRFISETYKFKEIKEISRRTVVNKSGNGPNHVDFPNIELQISTDNGKTYKISSKENLNIEQMYNTLKKQTADN